MYRLFFIAALLSGQALLTNAQAKMLEIPYGRSGRISYDLDHARYTVRAGTLNVIRDAVFTYKNHARQITSAAYTRARYSVQKTKRAGEKLYVIRLQAPGLPDVEQRFYVHPDAEYFLTRISICGKDLASNGLVPLESPLADIGARGDNRALFVPFDNDAFVRYAPVSLNDGAGLSSAELSAVYENTGRKGLVIGSVEHTVWKTGVELRGKGSALTRLRVLAGFSERKITRDSLPHGVLTGDTITSPKIFVGYFNDWRAGLEAYGESNRREDPPFVFNWTKGTPFGWNSWGVIQEKLTLDKALNVRDFFADSLKNFRNNGTAYIDLDSFWDNITGGMSGDYAKLKVFADSCKSRGLQPGAYWAPFTDWGFKSGGNRKAEGSDYLFSDMWTKTGAGYHDFDGARALDPTHPGTQRRIDFIIGKLKDCGFAMIKIDFLGHAAVESSGFFDKKIRTGMQAYRAGMEYLVEKTGGQMLIYAAISPSMATARYAHMRRIACDAWKTIKDSEYTLNGVQYGWWQNRMYNFIDADHVVFAGVSDGENRARLLSAVVTGPLILGDDFSSSGKWTETARALVQDPLLLQIARKGEAFRPLEGNSEGKGTTFFVRRDDSTTYIAAFNFSDRKALLNIPFGRAGLDPAKKYQVETLFRRYKKGKNEWSTLDLAGKDAELLIIRER